MIDWMGRAKLQIARDQRTGTAKTDETLLSSVLAGHLRSIISNHKGVSSVSSVPHGDLSEIAFVLRAAAESLIAAESNTTSGLHAAKQRFSGNPYMTPEQGDACHEGGWTEEEIAVFVDRTERFKQLGRVDAEHLAERLTLRDREVVRCHTWPIRQQRHLRADPYEAAVQPIDERSSNAHDK